MLPSLCLTKPVLVTAARWRFGLNVKGLGLGGGPRRRALDEIAAAAMELIVRAGKTHNSSQ
jgi:hypothetical protein